MLPLQTLPVSIHFAITLDTVLLFGISLLGCTRLSASLTLAKYLVAK